MVERVGSFSSFTILARMPYLSFPSSPTFTPFISRWIHNSHCRRCCCCFWSSASLCPSTIYPTHDNVPLNSLPILNRRVSNYHVHVIENVFSYILHAPKPIQYCYCNAHSCGPVMDVWWTAHIWPHSPMSMLWDEWLSGLNRCWQTWLLISALLKLR